MDCALVVDPPVPGSGDSPGAGCARVVPMHRVHGRGPGRRRLEGRTGGDPGRDADTQGFGFMTSEVSSEKPKGLSVVRVADSLRRARVERDSGAEPVRGRVLAVCGPAVVHTGAAPALARMVREGWVDLLFAGNGFATHDIESSVLGTSLGISLGEGLPAEHGHANHLRRDQRGTSLRLHRRSSRRGLAARRACSTSVCALGCRSSSAVRSATTALCPMCRPTRSQLQTR